MTEFELNTHKKNLKNIFDEIISVSKQPLFPDIDIEKFKKDFEEIISREKVLFVLVGPYSSGKSSIIRCLTKDESIEIGSDETTHSVSTYDQKIYSISDTPGLYTLNGEDEQKARDAIETADVILYVISAKTGFNPETRDDFLNLLSREEFNDKVFIIVNKADEIDVSRKNLYINEINTQLGQIKIEEKCNIFIFSAKKYWDGIKQNNNDLIDSSYFEDFILGLNQYISEKVKLSDRLSAPVKKLEEFIELIKVSLSTDEEMQQEKQNVEKLKISIANAERKAESTLNRMSVKYINQIEYDYIHNYHNENKSMSQDELKTWLQIHCDNYIDNLYKELADIFSQLDSVVSEQIEPVVEKINTEGYRENTPQKKGGVLKWLGGVFSGSNNMPDKAIKKSEQFVIDGTPKKSVVEKIPIIRKIIKSDKTPGGKGTVLYDVVKNVVPERFSEQASKGVYKISSVIQKHPNVIKGAGVFIGFAITVGLNVKDNIDSARKAAENEERKNKIFECIDLNIRKCTDDSYKLITHSIKQLRESLIDYHLADSDDEKSLYKRDILKIQNKLRAEKAIISGRNEDNE